MLARKPSLPPFKKGDTYSLVCIYKENREAVDITGFNIQCQMRRDVGDIVDTMIITIDPDQINNPGKFTIEPTTANTSSWRVGSHLMDIEIASAGVIRSTETFIQPVIEDITK